MKKFLCFLMAAFIALPIIFKPVEAHAGLSDLWNGFLNNFTTFGTKKAIDDYLSNNSINTNLSNVITWSNTETNNKTSQWQYKPNYDQRVYNDTKNTSNYRIVDNSSVYSPVDNGTHYYDHSTSYVYNYDDHQIYNITYSDDNRTYNNYIYGGDTYVSYVIESPDDPTFVPRYYEIYFVLPDGRSSYNLTSEEVKGIYTVYDVVPYERNFVDDGQTLGMLHLDGNWQNDSYGGGAAASSNVNFVEGYFEGGVSFSSSIMFTVPFQLNVGDKFTYFLWDDTNGWRYFGGSTVAYSFPQTPGTTSVSYNAETGKTLVSIYPNITSSSGFVLDEVRFLKSDTTVDISIAPSQPYDNNVAWSVPQTNGLTNIGVKTLSSISGYQIGGVRPTYPNNGFVFVNVDEDFIIRAVEVWNGSQYDSADAAIYYDSAWRSCIGFSLLTNRFNYNPSPSGGSGGGGGSDSDNPSYDKPSFNPPSINLPDQALPGYFNNINTTFNDIYGFIGNVPTLFATIFSFLPSWVHSMLGWVIGFLFLAIIVGIIIAVL